jgi:hypothetical protein
LSGSDAASVRPSSGCARDAYQLYAKRDTISTDAETVIPARAISGPSCEMVVSVHAETSHNKPP